MTNCDSNTSNDLPLGSANELTRVKKLRQQIKGGKFLGFLGGGCRGVRQFKQIEQQLNELVSLVDNFYILLGKRGWIFVECFNLERIKSIVNDNIDADSAEKALIRYFQEEDMLEYGIKRMNRFEDMRPRMHLIEKAKCDYSEGRYYSVTLVLISVIDGFVNDIDKARRRGLHTRTPEEMHTEDCVATMWSGLPEVQKRFVRSFNAREEAEVYDVFRNGIIHGMITEYDNVVVASKAWCMLFAVCDWAEAVSQDKLNEKEKSEQKTQSILSVLRGTFEGKREIKKNEKFIKQWTPHKVDLKNPSEEDIELVASCRDFFNAWNTKNYGALAQFFPNYMKKSKGALAGEARYYYSNYEIQNYHFLSIDRQAAAVAEVCTAITSQKRSWKPVIRFVRMNEKGIACCDREPGEWKVMGYACDPFKDKE